MDLEPKQRTAADQDGLPFNPGVAPVVRLTDSETQSLKICLDFYVFSSNSFWLFGAEFSSMSSVLAI